ncbi:capsular polysaccharide transport system permease protein [Rhizobium soli]|uniref:Capsular polysaccharide transport system permease protein n=1 Tax=Rhizobium soli TaxID=424798 RepID=A0A7X0MTV1_9HYPH|nr:RkpR, polysaccharide export protein [Rhizobium soli]MBB6511099.1 capsular polysaccharide transport system permease protein [Rhizobium soli]
MRATANNAGEPNVGQQTAPFPRNLRLLTDLLDLRPQVSEQEQAKFDGNLDAETSLVARSEARLKARHWIILTAFLAIVAIPTATAGGYMAFVAADQFNSTTSFSVRSIEASQPGDLLGIFTQASGGSTASDSYMLLDYILSAELIQEAHQELNLDKIFAPRGHDFFYSLSPSQSIEDKVEYWKRMVSVSFDQSSGILKLNVKTFDAASAQLLTKFILTASERLVNSISDAAKEEVLRDALNAVQQSESRLASTQVDLRRFRDLMQETDPTEGAKLASQIVSTLEQQLAIAKTELSTALSQMGENSPRVKVLRSQIASLEQQVRRERGRFGSGEMTKSGRNGTTATADVAGRMEQYEKLETQRQFSERAYTAALGGLEKARIEASSKERYMAAFIKPTLPELAQYPNRLLNTLLVFGLGIITWGVGVMVFYNIKDRN